MKFTNLRKISLEHLWAITVICGVFIFVNTHPIRPHDFWWHLALGREIISSGKIPTIDVYSYTMSGSIYPSYQMFWLVDIGLYSIYQLGGPALVVFTHSLLIVSTYSLLLWLCWKISNSWRIAAAAALFAVVLGIDNWNVRPQTISYLLGVLFLSGIYSYRNTLKLRWLVVIPLGMLVWVNSHGSFVIGLVLIGIWLGDELWGLLSARFKKEEINTLDALWAALISLGVALLVCLINPRGFGIVSYLRTLIGNSMVQNLVPEWAPPTFDTLYGSVFLIGLLLISVIFAISPKRPSFLQLTTFLVFGVLGLKTTRGIIWFGLVMAPILADHISSLVNKSRKVETSNTIRPGNPISNLVILAILIILSIISLPWFKDSLPLPRQKAGLISAETPVQATEFLLMEQPAGELFHDMGFGSYLIWATQPEYKVFVDTRIELYPPEMWRDYLALGNAIPGWEQLLKRYSINTVMLNPSTQVALINSLEQSPDWSIYYSDQSAVIFVKDQN